MKATYLVLTLFICTLYVSALPNITRQNRDYSVRQSADNKQLQSDSLQSNVTRPQYERQLSSNNTPTGLFLCDEMLPLFKKTSGIEPQHTDSPFTIHVDPDQIEPGDRVKITISRGTDKNHPLKGFILQVEELSSATQLGRPNDQRVGSGRFLPSDNVNLQTCHIDDDTSVYVGTDNLVDLSVIWQSSSEVEGSLMIRGTFVESSDIYWDNVYSNRLKVYSSDSSEKKTSITISDELRDAVSETLEDISEPPESVEEVLLHQGVRTVQKLGGSDRSDSTNGGDPIGIKVVRSEIDNAVTVDDDDIADPTQHDRYLYAEMNAYPQDFEIPQTSEFIGSLMNLAGGGRGGGGGLGSMMNMVKTASTVSRLFKGGSRGRSSGGGGGGGLLGSLLGGGGGNSGGGSGGGLGNLIGSLAPPPSGQPPTRGPVTITPTDEPSLADLLGVDPSTVVESSPRAAPGSNNPLAGLLGGGSSGGGSGGGLGSLLGGLTGGGGGGGGGALSNIASIASLAGPLSGLLGGGNKNKNTPPSLPGFGGGFGGMGGPGFGGGGFGGMGGPGGGFGSMLGGGGGSNPFGFGGFTQTPSMSQVMGMMQQQQAQITSLQNQLSASGISGGMGSFGTMQPSFGQQVNSRLLGVPGQSPAIRSTTPFGQFNPMPNNGFARNSFGMTNTPMTNNFGTNQWSQNQFQRQNQLPQQNQFGNNPNANRFGQQVGRFPQQNNNGFGNQMNNNRFGQQAGNQPRQQQFGQNQIGSTNPNGLDSVILNQLMQQNQLLMEQLQHMRGPNGAPPQGGTNVNRNPQQPPWQNGNNVNGASGTNSNGILGSSPPRQNTFPANNGASPVNPGNFPSGNNGNTPSGGTGFGQNNGNFPGSPSNTGSQNNPSSFPPANNVPNNANNVLPGSNNGFGQGNGMFPTTGGSQTNSNFGNNNNNGIPNNGNGASQGPNNGFGQNSGFSPNSGSSPPNSNFGNNNNNGFDSNSGGNFNNGPPNNNNNNNFGSNPQNPFGSSDGGSISSPSSPSSMFGPGGSSNFGGGSGSSLSDLFGGGGAGTLSSQLGGLLQGGLPGAGNDNPLAGLLGGAGGPGGSGSLGDDLSSLMGNVDTSAIGNMLGQMGMDPNTMAGGSLDSLLGGVDVNAMQNVLAGEQGQDLIGSITGLLNGPQGGGLMDAVTGMLSGDPNAGASIESLLGSTNPNDLQSMAKQAEGILAQTGIDPNQLLSQLMG